MTSSTPVSVLVAHGASWADVGSSLRLRGDAAEAAYAKDP